MHITFDPAKDSLNIANHGVSLAVAERLEWDLILVSEDTRDAYRTALGRLRAHRPADLLCGVHGRA